LRVRADLDATKSWFVWVCFEYSNLEILNTRKGP
jgi:hypothetical protein